TSMPPSMPPSPPPPPLSPPSGFSPPRSPSTSRAAAAYSMYYNPVGSPCSTVRQFSAFGGSEGASLAGTSYAGTHASGRSHKQGSHKQGKPSGPQSTQSTQSMPGLVPAPRGRPPKDKVWDFVLGRYTCAASARADPGRYGYRPGSRRHRQLLGLSAPASSRLRSQGSPPLIADRAYRASLLAAKAAGLPPSWHVSQYPSATHRSVAYKFVCPCGDGGAFLTLAKAQRHLGECGGGGDVGAKDHPKSGQVEALKGKVAELWRRWEEGEEWRVGGGGSGASSAGAARVGAVKREREGGESEGEEVVTGGKGAGRRRRGSPDAREAEARRRREEAERSELADRELVRAFREKVAGGPHPKPQGRGRKGWAFDTRSGEWVAIPGAKRAKDKAAALREKIASKPEELRRFCGGPCKQPPGMPRRGTVWDSWGGEFVDKPPPAGGG
ncbi:hypothetical protein TeGR_g9296, partial [Tetraparma gracilis]